MQRTVAEEEAGQRLDRLLHSWSPDVSRSRVQTWLKGGHVQVNGNAKVRASDKVSTDQVIVWSIPAPPEPFDMSGTPVHELVVLHEDEAIVVVNKTAGLLSHRNHLGQGHSVVELAAARFGDLPEPELIVEPMPNHPVAPTRGGIVHRLDRGTSGVMVLARTPEALVKLQAQFKQRTVSKAYRTFVHQTPRFDSEMVDEAIEPDPRMPDRRRVAKPDIKGYLSPKARSAQTMITAVTRFSRACEMLCEPKTGRTHQIRVHLLHLGMPIIGDRTYRWPGAMPNPLGDDAPIPARPALHAESLEIDHPVSGERLRFEAPMPEDMQVLQRWLQETWPV